MGKLESQKTDDGRIAQGLKLKVERIRMRS